MMWIVYASCKTCSTNCSCKQGTEMAAGSPAAVLFLPGKKAVSLLTALLINICMNNSQLTFFWTIFESSHQLPQTFQLEQVIGLFVLEETKLSGGEENMVITFHPCLFPSIADAICAYQTKPTKLIWSKLWDHFLLGQRTWWSWRAVWQSAWCSRILCPLRYFCRHLLRWKQTWWVMSQPRSVWSCFWQQ